MTKLILTTLTLIALFGLGFAECKADDNYRTIRKLLSDADVTHPNKEFALLYEIGDEHIADLISALKDEDPEICRRAQVVIRYLANPTGMKSLHAIYATQKETILAGTVPVPLDDWDYQFIQLLFFEHPGYPWGNLEFSYVLALMLDGSHTADKVLSDIDKSHGLSEVRRFYNIGDVNDIRKVLLGEVDLSKLVLNNAFFVSRQDMQYTSARLVALNGTKIRALVQVYINRGVLAEEWWHVVIQKNGAGWRFNSVYQAAVS